MSAGTSWGGSRLPYSHGAAGETRLPYSQGEAGHTPLPYSQSEAGHAPLPYSQGARASSASIAAGWLRSDTTDHCAPLTITSGTSGREL